MHAVAMIAMVFGVLGFVLTFAGVLSIAPLGLWGAIAGAGMVVAAFTRRPNN